MSKRKREFRWINLFVRDILLILVLMAVNYWTNFNSWWVGFTTGMTVVWVSWHYFEYISSKRRLVC